MAEFTIRLEELELRMFLGIHDHERAAMQRVLVSAEITAVVAEPSAGAMFDYDRVAEFIRSFNGQAIETQEELITRIHAFILELGARAATVCSKKPDIYPDARAIGVCFSG